MTCPHCVAAGRDVFAGRVVRRDLRRYRKKGPSRTTGLLLRGLRQRGVQDATLLDVGGGVGVNSQELLASGAASAVEVEASPEYAAAAREEAARRGTSDRMEVLEGDFVDLAPDLAPADIVTLDRAVCCYPHMRLLVGASATRARRLVGLVLPREHVVVRLGMGLLNLGQRVRRSAFRVYVHASRDVEDELERHGFRRAWESRTWLWRVRVYERTSGEGRRTEGDGRRA